MRKAAMPPPFSKCPCDQRCPTEGQGSACALPGLRHSSLCVMDELFRSTVQHLFGQKREGGPEGDAAAKVSQALCEGSAVRFGVQDPGVCRDFLSGEVMLKISLSVPISKTGIRTVVISECKCDTCVA